jgi:hypothetical protein
MSLCLLAEEPAAGPWHAERLTAVAADMIRLGLERGADNRPVVLAIDGRSSGGKTTLAGRLQGVVAARPSCIPTTSPGGTPGAAGPSY